MGRMDDNFCNGQTHNYKANRKLWLPCGRIVSSTAEKNDVHHNHSRDKPKNTQRREGAALLQLVTSRLSGISDVKG